MSALGDRIRSEAAIAARPGQMQSLEDIADLVEALEAENAEYARFWGQDLVPALAARDAVIAEARYEHSTSSLVAGRELCDGCHEAVPCTTATILSRVPQGAAEP